MLDADSIKAIIGMRKNDVCSIGPEKDTVVTDDQAFDYALERCLHGTPDDQKEFKEMLVEWFYSGSWVKEESEETYA